jgi:hypothetical protein
MRGKRHTTQLHRTCRTHTTFRRHPAGHPVSDSKAIAVHKIIDSVAETIHNGRIPAGVKLPCALLSTERGRAAS